MRSKLASIVVFTVSLLIAGCGGGHYTNPYDGVWEAVYPDDQSSTSPTLVVQCSTLPPALTIKDGEGSTTQTMTCLTEVIDATTGATTSSYTNNYYYNISVAIDANGLIKAIVNGASFSGQCISQRGCSAQSGGNALSLTR